MEALNLWHLFALPTRKTAALIWLMLLPLFASAQFNNKSRHASSVDNQQIAFGFTIGLNYASVRAKFADFPIVVPDDPEGRTLENINVEAQPGITLGLILNARLGDNTDFRMIPAVSLQQRNFFFQFDNGTEELRTLQSSYFQVPFLLKFKSDVYKDYRAYIMTGPVVSFNLASQKDVLNDPTLLKIDNNDFGWTFAFGFDLYGDKLKLSPELSYNFGMRNVYVPVNEDVPGAIQRVFMQTLTLSINFGG